MYISNYIINNTHFKVVRPNPNAKAKIIHDCDDCDFSCEDCIYFNRCRASIDDRCETWYEEGRADGIDY